MPFPLFHRLVVETHAYCNRSCWFCARTGPFGGGRFADGVPVKKKMPLSQAQRILREAAKLGFHGWVALYLYDEPFAELAHQLTLAKYARALGMHPCVNTNTDYLQNRPELWKRIGNAYDQITVSLYDASPEEIPKQRKMWASRFGKQIGLSCMKTIGDRPALEPNKHFKRIIAKGPCLWPYDKLIIAYDGQSPLCCFDIGATFGLKNAFDVSVKDLWFDPKRVRIIKDLAAGKRERFALCSICNIPPAKRPRGGLA